MYLTSKDHLVKLLKQLMLSTSHLLNGKPGGSSPNAADVPTLLGDGSFSLLDVDRKATAKQVKPPPLYLRWPHLKANQVQGLSLREIGGGFAKHHRAPSVRSACYAIAKPCTMVQKMQNIKKLRGHRVAVYCAIFDGSGRYVISGSDDRLVKIWSMETAFCLASCRGHEGDITDLAVSSNNAVVASASNDYSIRVWRLPDGMPISVLRGHDGSVNTIAFSPRPSAVYQLLSSSDDGTCRVWDARTARNPCVYVPGPSDAITGKGNAPPAYLPSSSNAQRGKQILCCAYNATGTVFVTGSADTSARVWSASYKPNTDNSEQPIHELDILSGHEHDVNYVQFSGCAVASKIGTSDSWKEENTLKFRNFRYSHDNIVTCSRDGSAIIWVPRSRRSHGKVGRWIRAYHLKVPPPPLPPQPPRGGPRQRLLPTPRGVNMIIWSLDNRFVLAAIMDCRICVWNAVDGSLVHSLTGHTESSYVLDVHPFNPRIAMSAGYDGRTIVWDIWEGIPIRTYEIGRFQLVDGKFSPDGTSIVLSDEVGQIYFLSTGQGESQKDAKYDQFFLGDYRPLIQDAQGNVLDQETQLPPYRRNLQEPLSDSNMMPYPEPYQTQFQRRRLGALGIEWRPPLINYAVGPDFSVGQDYHVTPLVELEGALDPQPEWDALLWEPEHENVSDDNDSEYNVNEDNSSAAEQGTVSAISDSDLEYSEGDSSNTDSLRRSRRKKHNTGVEGTTSGRRVRKRNLEECNGNSSANRRVKKSKGSSTSAKRKSSKAKTSRPQRTAAHNARNIFSQIDETSTDGEDDYSDNESSGSFQDSENLSEPERKIHSKREELKNPLLEEPATASKPPSYSESHADGKSRPRLVLKISIRDSKKNVPLEDTRIAFENQADMVCQSSRPETLESVQETSPDTSFMGPDTYGMSDVTNANLPEWHNRNETAITHLDTSMCHEGSADQRKQMRRHACERSRSGDALLTDTEDNGHPEFNANGKSEHMTSKFETGGDNLNGGDRGRSRSDKCTEDSPENNEIFHSSHSQDIKMKAPIKPTKIVIKKKQTPEDMEGSKLKFGSSKADSIGARSDVISGNPSFTGPDRLTKALEGGDDRNTSSPQLLNSYSEQRNYNHVHERNKSYKGEPSPNGFGFDLEQNASTYSNHQHGLGIDLSNAVTDPIRRTRSIRMKTTSKEPNASNTRIKIRGGQSSRGVSSLEDSSIYASDELHQRTRSAGNRSDEYIASDPGILTQSMPNRHVKKLSWLMLSEAHEEGCRYIPQLGDEVVYLRQGHEEYIKSCPTQSGSRISFQGLRAVEICKVEKLEYAELPGSGDSCCKLRLKFVDPSSHMHGKSFKFTLPELIDFSDFVIEKTLYDAAMKKNWSPDEKCTVWWRNEDGKGGSWWHGQIIAVKAKSDEFPDSPWDRFKIRYNTNPPEDHLHSPWELNDPDIQLEHPHIDHEIRDKLLAYFAKLDHREKYDIQALNRVVAKSEFSNRFPVPFYPELIQLRLKNDYYRNVEGVKHDIMVMLSNAEDFYTVTKSFKMQSKVKRISEWFRRKLERI
ncbi:WD40 domain-containing protein [Trifolium repens]|nr:WD40 domain-containing protein [Trifolium repens]